ncbi:MAG: HAD family phosphatase [Myxococcaceae bacterium]
MGLKALLLDLGNVLAFHDNELLFEKMAAAFGTTREQMRARVDAKMWERVNRGSLAGDALRVELTGRLGGQLTPDEFEALWSCHFRVYQPMVERVRQLRERFEIVIVSNTHDLHVRYLKRQIPLLGELKLVASCETGLIKPEPEIYRRALALAQVEPGEAAFFDDLERYVTAARELGIHGRVFNTVEQFDRDLAELTSSS